MKKLLFILLLSGCVSSPDYDEALNNWVGASQENLINSWGEPAAINYITPNQQLFSYFQISPSGQEFCRTTFTLTDGVVNDFEFEGDNCSVNVP